MLWSIKLATPKPPHEPMKVQGLELGVFAEESETPESREFNEILEKEGAKAALAWQEARLARETASDE